MLKKILVCVLLAVFFVYISGCATILYPSRSGQTTHGGVDVGMLVLDILLTGLLGVVIDLITGAIYFPASYCLPSTGLGDADITSMYQLGDEISLPRSGAVNFSLPVRAESGTEHSFLLEVVSETGRVLGQKEVRFTGTSGWEDLSSSLDVCAGGSTSGHMRVLIDGQQRVEVAVSFVDAGK